MAIRKFLFVSALALSLVVAADAAVAGTLKLNSAAYRQGNGGEFLVSQYDTYYVPPHADVMQHEGATNNKDFLTFCIEYNEYISLSGNSYHYTTDAAAYGGGGGAVGGQDPITEAMAKLFYAYWTGQLDDISYTASNSTSIDFDYDNASGDRSADGAQLQIALWSMAGEEVLGSADPDAVGNELAAAYIEAANSWDWSSDLGIAWTGIGGVRALNLYNTGTLSNAQSMLVIVPLPPGALMGLALLASMGLVVFVRRRRQRLSLG